MKKLDYKWVVLILLWVAFSLQQGTRQLFGPSVSAICGSLGLYVGIVGCGGLAGRLAGKGGANWRTPFWIFGGLGLVWAFVLALFLKNMRPIATQNSQALEPLNFQTSDKPTIREAVKAVFSKPMALCVILGLAMMIYVDIGFKNWMPRHLQPSFPGACPYLKQWAGLHAVFYLIGALVILSARLFCLRRDRAN